MQERTGMSDRHNIPLGCFCLLTLLNWHVACLLVITVMSSFRGFLLVVIPIRCHFLTPLWLTVSLSTESLTNVVADLCGFTTFCQGSNLATVGYLASLYFTFLNIF